MSALRLVVGLGNPGSEYEDTRHNAGFWFVDRLARARKALFRHESRFHGEVARIEGEEGDYWLLKPATFMNQSGRSVSALARFYKIQPDEILAVHDELDLLPGSIKLKRGGGAAGHNGLKDMAAALGSPDFWRLRVGIGHPGHRDQVVDFVLHRPGRAEQEAIDAALVRAEQVFPMLLRGDTKTALQQLHTQSKPAA
jgi:PTH1 family peptidyl-tRNA hydrolase